MTNLTNDTAWIKANELIKEKYGKSLTYRAIKLIRENPENANTENYYSNGEDLIVPLKLKNFNLGDVVVDRGSYLNQQQKNEVSELIKFLIEPKIYSIQLKQSEENLPGSRPLALVDSGRVVELYRSEKFRKPTLSPIIMLKSHTELTRNKVALKIHEMSERNLFVHLEDILPSLHSKDDLKTLSDTTIYINDILSLSKATLNLLQEYLAINSPDGPLFLVGSSLSLEAVNKTDLPQTLKKDLLDFYFDIDRVPLSQQDSKDILELLFFQPDLVLS